MPEFGNGGPAAGGVARSDVAAEENAGTALPAELRRRFEAVIFGWEAAALSPHADQLRTQVEDACAAGVDVAVATEASMAVVQASLPARPPGPGRLYLSVNGGAEVFAVDERGFRLLDRRGWSTDPSEPAGWIVADLWSRGINPGDVVCVGLANGVGAVASAALRLAASAEPGLLEPILADQLRRRRGGDVPRVQAAPGWALVVEGFDPRLTRVHESLLTLADGRLGTRGAPLVGNGATTPAVLLAGAYEGTGAESELARLPLWSRFDGDGSLHPRRRVLDLHSGVLYEEGPHTSLRFSSLARPATVAVRMRGERPAPASDDTNESAGASTAEKRRHVPGIVHTALLDRPCDESLERLGAYDPDPGAAEAALAAAEASGFDRLLREHREAWSRRWSEADVVIDGDPDLQRAIRLSLFHLMGSVADQHEAAVGARGLSGSAYRGHVFWDSDVFVLPFLAATHPQAARAMLEYRIRRLPAARAEARRLGRGGARFPWESAADGTDVTPVAARLPTGDVVAIHTGELEEHIVACVAWAAAYYSDWTGDSAFTAEGGRDLLVETARYWASRVRVDRFGGAHIDGVVGPDEYHHSVDDNAFTNVMARWNLRRAIALDSVAAGEREAWREVADALVDGYDPETKLYEQFAGFLGLRPIVIAEIAPQRPIAADLLLGFDRVARAQVVKQPDVLMLHHLVPDEVEPNSLLANLDFYEPRTAHGSSLSPAIHASLLARAGRPGPAVAWLRIASRIDLDDLTGTTAGGLHLATMGGLWQALTFGFAGVRVCRDRLVVHPHLPDSWNALELGLRYRGAALRLHIDKRSVEIDSDVLRLQPSDDHWEVVPR